MIQENEAIHPVPFPRKAGESIFWFSIYIRGGASLPLGVPRAVLLDPVGVPAPLLWFPGWRFVFDRVPRVFLSVSLGRFPFLHVPCAFF